MAETQLLIPPNISSARWGAFRQNWHSASFSGHTMGTSWSATLSHPSSIDKKNWEATFTQILDTVIRQMSPWETDSDLQTYEKASAGSWVSFNPESFEVLQRALEIAHESNGVYDPSFAKAIDYLGFGPSPTIGYTYHSPEVCASLASSGYGQIKLNPPQRQVWQPGGIGIDLCSIAKGYAVDLLARAIETEGIENYFVEIGGEARGLGCKANGDPWLFELERPSHLQRIAPTQVALCGLSIATSGNYTRYQIVDGQTIGHLVNPLWANCEQDLLSVSIFSDNCMDADAYASALYLMGLKSALEFAEHRGLAALFLSNEGEVLSSEAKEFLR